VVAGGSFGQLFATPVDGQVYGQPLIAGGTLVVTTEKNEVYGLTPANGRIIWRTSLGPPLPSSTVGCPDLTPDIGITSAPVYDPATGTLYVVAVVDDGPAAAQPHQYLEALDAQTGTVRWKQAIQGGMSGSALQLTRAAKDQAGSAVYDVPEASNGLKATYKVQMGGGTGADGMTFSLLGAAAA
jgi:outer membrane protein assembly factor BamB